MTAPFFTIITCTYNAGESLRACIRSVEEQSFGSYEHLFIDAFSTDATAQILSEYAAQAGGRVRVVQSPPAGVTRAMNEGIELARGSVLLHLHGDDRLADGEVLAKVHGVFLRHHPAVVVGNCRLTGHPTLTHTWPENPLKRLVTKACMPVIMFYSNPIAHPSTYISRSVFERNGRFDEKYHVVMDYDYWFRILNKETVWKTDDVLSVYHFHSDTISTRQMELGLREIDEIRRKYRSAYPLAFFLSEYVLRPALLVKNRLFGSPPPFRPSTP